MKRSIRSLMMISSLVLTLAVSAMWTAPAFADDGNPPPSETPELVQPIEETPTPETLPAEELPVETVQDEVQPEAPDDLLSQIPEGTDIVVVNADGETLPLASTEAVEIIDENDPIWCPTGVAPISGVGGCTTTKLSFNGGAGLVAFLSNKTVNGTIWILGSYQGTVGIETTSIVLDGSLLGTTKNFALTVKGGWTGTSAGAINTLDPSEFNVPLHIINWNGDVNLSDIVILNPNVVGTDALKVQTTKNIKLDRVVVNGNAAQGGADLNNSTGAATMTVIVNNSTFSGNNGFGLNIASAGKVTLLNVTAQNNTDGNGVTVDNSASPTKQDVMISGINQFNGNLFDGLRVISAGLITLTDVTASNNGGDGAYLQNTAGTLTITLVGTNIFGDNAGWGLQALTNGAMVIKNLYTNSNGSGANIANQNAATPLAVTISSSEFKFNDYDGLVVTSKGIVTLANITANSNGHNGITINNTPGVAAVTINITTVINNNGENGLIVKSRGMITLASIVANGNGLFAVDPIQDGFGVNLDNSSASIPVNIVLTGVNTFIGNFKGLIVTTAGTPLLNSLVITGSTGGSGATIRNDINIAAPKPVTLAGTNVFNNNLNYGLDVLSYGLITVSNLTANNNGYSLSSPSDGVYLDNSGVNVAAGISLIGASTFNNNKRSGLVVDSKGVITLGIVNANGNGVANNEGYGIDLNNTWSTTGAGVTITGTNYFVGNYDGGLYIRSNGVVSLNSINANSSVNGNGATINNSTGSTTAPVNVLLTGINNFNSNAGSGLDVHSRGLITLNTVTANGNGSGGSEYGLYLVNDYAATTLTARGVTLAGVNVVNNTDGLDGVKILSKGIIMINSLTASGTLNGDGADLYNAYSGFVSGVSMTGVNNFSDNSHVGLNITSLGSVTVTSVTANNNDFEGVLIDTDNPGSIGSVVVAGVNQLNNNGRDGLKVISLGTITINNVTANGNGSVSGGGAMIHNSDASLAKNVIFAGTNTFNNNYSYGLVVETKGAITSALALTANDTQDTVSDDAAGIYLNNAFGSTASKQPITLSGKVTAIGNYASGLYVSSYGIVTISGITSTGNTAVGGYGTYISNMGADTALGVNLNGINAISDNHRDGLFISTKGAIRINGLTANGNGIVTSAGVGANLSSTVSGGVAFTGVNTFNGNYTAGLAIQTNGAITLSTVTASNTVNGMGLSVDNTASGTVVPQNVAFLGVSVFNNNYDTGALVNTYGTVTLGGITANSNGLGSGTGYGVFIDNSGGTLARTVILNGVNTFSGNHSGGLRITSIGSITVGNLVASNSTNGFGAHLQNDFGTSIGTIALTGISRFEGNSTNGLEAFSFAAITLSNITANGNGSVSGYGVYIQNHTAVALQNVTLSGINTFSNNAQSGLFVHSKGLVTLSSITAINNGENGVIVDNDEVGAVSGVTLTGSSLFTNNFDAGLFITSKGAVSITKIVSNSNNDGLVVNTTGNVTVTCGNFVNNTQYGWWSTSASGAPVISMIGVVSAGNGTNSLLSGGGILVTVRNCPLP